MKNKNNYGINDDLHICPICKDKIGYIDMELGVFDSRYFKNMENHKCDDWYPLNGGK
jgi:uncharacterized protein YbaR (Trm112 family)